MRAENDGEASAAGATPAPLVWVVHAGRRGRDAAQFEAAGIVGLTLPSVPHLERLSRQAGLDAVLVALARQKQADLKTVSGRDRSYAALLLRFVHEVGIGDRVITPDSQAGEVLLGVVTGEYRLEIEPSVSGYHHTRGVRWLGRMARADLSPQGLRSIGAPSPLFRPGAEDQLRELAIWSRDDKRGASR